MKEIVLKTFWSLLVFAFTFIPLWIWLGTRSLANPEGFWQEIAIGALGLLFLGGLQLIGLVFFVSLLMLIWK